MIRGHLDVNGIAVDIFALEGSEHPNQDRWLVYPTADALRVAVIDGVTPWHTEPVLGHDAAQFAANTLARSLALPIDLETAFRHANKELFNPALSLTRRQAMAAAVAVDIRLTRGYLDCSGLVALDCEWWVNNEGMGSPRLLIGGEARTAEAIHAAAERRGHARPADESVRRQWEAEDFNTSDSYRGHAVGRFENPRFTQGVGIFTHVLLTSDGACIQDANLEAINAETVGTWLESLSKRDYRDDITALLITAPAIEKTHRPA